MLIGGIGFNPADDESRRLVTLGTTIPLTILGSADLSDVLMYVALLASAADQLEAKFSTGDLF